MIVGKTVRLRAWEPDDVEAMWRWQNDWDVQRLGDGEPELALSREAVGRQFGPGSPLTMFMIETIDGRLIGSCSYHDYSGRSRSCTVGIWIGEADARGQGHGTEAMRLLLSYLFRHMGLHRVSLQVLANNAAAIASYRKCGFREEGRDREAVFQDGIWVDTVRMGVLDSEAILD